MHDSLNSPTLRDGTSRDGTSSVGETSTFRLETLAATPRWSAERVEALRGRCRGSLLKDWAANFSRHFGPGTAAHIRRALGPDLSAQLPDAPSQRQWLPVAAQIRVTDIVIDDLLGGDPLGLEALLRDGLDRSGRVARAMIRRMGPAILRGAGQIHQQCYDLGSASASVSRRSLVLRSEGAEFMTNPTWQLLQLIGHRLLIDASGHTPLRVEGRAMAPAAFEAHVSWA